MESVDVTANPVKDTSSNQVHCRVCGHRPRGSIYVKSLNEQVITHIRKKHPASMLDFFSELDILFGQEKGDDSRCSIHRTEKRGAE